FDAPQILDPRICRPFASDRAGINLGEGAASVLIEANPDSRPLGQIIGTGMSSEAFHMTQPRDDGSGIRLAIERALLSANANPNKVAYVNAHGTGTMHNDAAELRAIESVFGDPLPRVESTKMLSGHTLAGSG